MFNDIFRCFRKSLYMTVGAGVISVAINASASASELSAGETVPPPIGYMRFCLLNPGDCKTSPDAEHTVRLNSWRWAELQAVQNIINSQIRPRRDGDLWDRSVDIWEYPQNGYGDCEDYALAKREALLNRGWPGKALRLVTARTDKGEAHVVLAVSTSEGDYILDNLSSEVRRWENVNYQWVSVQDRDNPLRWRAARPVETTVASLAEPAFAQ